MSIYMCRCMDIHIYRYSYILKVCWGFRVQVLGFTRRGPAVAEGLEEAVPVCVKPLHVRARCLSLSLSISLYVYIYIYIYKYIYICIYIFIYIYIYIYRYIDRYR